MRKTKNLISRSEKARIRQAVDLEANQVADVMETLISNVRRLNSNLNDPRLDDQKQTFEALSELKTYNSYLGRDYLVFVNLRKNRSGELRGWFEA